MSRTYPIPFLPPLTPHMAGWADASSEPRAYLAGPMRGYELHNFPAFAQAALILRRHGWLIENPAEYDLAAGVNPACTDESKWPITVREMLRVDFRIILERVNAIILLPGWRKSLGANMELAIAYHVGLPAWEIIIVNGLMELRKLHFDGPPQVTILTTGGDRSSTAEQAEDPQPERPTAKKGAQQDAGSTPAASTTS